MRLSRDEWEDSNEDSFAAFDEAEVEDLDVVVNPGTS